MTVYDIRVCCERFCSSTSNGNVDMKKNGKDQLAW